MSWRSGRHSEPAVQNSQDGRLQADEREVIAMQVLLRKAATTTIMKIPYGSNIRKSSSSAGHTNTNYNSNKIIIMITILKITFCYE